MPVNPSSVKQGSGQESFKHTCEHLEERSRLMSKPHHPREEERCRLERGNGGDRKDEEGSNVLRDDTCPRTCGVSLDQRVARLWTHG